MSNYININNKEEDNECMICFDNVDIDLTYVKCHNCHKLFHHKCMDSWKNKKQQKVGCIHCTKEELLLHETINTFCCCFKLIKLKEKKK